MESNDLFSSYERGIEVAVQNGAIHLHADIDNEYDVRAGFTEFNTRTMDPLAQQLIEDHRISRGDGEYRVFLMGGGSGREAINDAVEGAHVTLLSKNPMNPYAKLTNSMNGIDDRLSYILRAGVSAGLRRRIADTLMRHECVCPEFLLRLQQQYGEAFFQLLSIDRPFIHQQEIGSYRNIEFAYPADAMYENMGAFFYTTDDRRDMTSAYGQLAEDGILYIADIREEALKELRRIKEPADALFASGPEKATVLLRRRHWLADRFKGETRGMGALQRGLAFSTEDERNQVSNPLVS